MEENKLRFAVVGCGHIGKHIPVKKMMVLSVSEGAIEKIYQNT